MYLININDSAKETLKLFEKKLVKIKENQKNSEAIIQWFLIQSKFLLKIEFNKKKIQINVTDISGIAGPVSKDMGNKYNKIIEIFLKSNLI